MTRSFRRTAASAIGAGIWAVRFVAMPGFAVSGTDIRYDVLLTLASLLVAGSVVCAGVFAVGHSSGRARSPLLRRLTTAPGVAGMHRLGTAR